MYVCPVSFADALFEVGLWKWVAFSPGRESGSARQHVSHYAAAKGTASRRIDMVIRSVALAQADVGSGDGTTPSPTKQCSASR